MNTTTFTGTIKSGFNAYSNHRHYEYKTSEKQDKEILLKVELDLKLSSEGKNKPCVSHDTDDDTFEIVTNNYTIEADSDNKLVISDHGKKIIFKPDNNDLNPGLLNKIKNIKGNYYATEAKNLVDGLLKAFKEPKTKSRK